MKIEMGSSFKRSFSSLPVIASVAGKGHIHADKEGFGVGMLPLIIRFSLQEAGCVKAEINKGLWQLSSNS